MGSLVIIILVLLSLLGAKSSDERSELSEMHLAFPNASNLQSLHPVETTELAVSSSVSLPHVLLDSLQNINATLIVKSDGMVSLVDLRSKVAIWSFVSGPPSYSFCQRLSAFENHLNDSKMYNLCIGNDGYLYEQARHSDGVWVHKKLGPIQDFFSRPQVLSGGILAHMTKSTTLFLIDIHSGSVVRMLPETLSSPKVENSGRGLALRGEKKMHGIEHLLFVRSDYTLRAFSPNTSEILCTVEYFDVAVSAHLSEVWRDYASMSSPQHNDWLILSPQSNLRPKITGHSDHNKKHETSEECFTQALENLAEPLSNNIDVTMNIYSAKVLKHSETVIKSSLSEDPHCESGTCLAYRVDNSKNIQVKLHAQPGHVAYGTLVADIFLFVIAFILFGISIFFLHHTGRQSDKTSLKQFPSPRRRKSKKVTSCRYVIASKDEEHEASKNRKHKTMLSLETVNEHNDFQILNKETIITTADSSELYEGRSIGKLFICKTEIAKGSNGTSVYEGIYDHRKVAVKRLLRAHNDIAFKEIDNLILSDQHPNIVRLYGVEQDLDFIYISLERCSCSLSDFIQLHSNNFSDSSCTSTTGVSLDNCDARFKSLKEFSKDVRLWNANGYPSTVLLKLMRDMVCGLAHLHDLGLIHRDLKPHNVLLSYEQPLCAKISDMGISKCLSKNMSALSNHATGCGSSGWQAPEQLQHGRQTRAVDLFSLGCVLFFCLTGGRHPFGDHLERDINIVKNHMDLFLVEHIPEAVDLMSHLLESDPEQRPNAKDVLNHPLFWDSEKRLSFLRDASDRIEAEDRQSESLILKGLESAGQVVLRGSWDTRLEIRFLQDLGRYRKYRYDSIRDLLRVIRNKLNHYGDLQPETKELLGPMPEGFDSYFASRFPKLLIEVYKVINLYCKKEECFRKYFNADPISYPCIFGGT